MLITYKFSLLPSKCQHKALRETLESQRQLYNAALEERIDCFSKTGKGVTFVDQCKSLTQCRRDIYEMGLLPLKLQRWTLKRLDDAFASFFRRAKARKGKVGFPRFRGQEGWNSFGFNEFKGIRFDGCYLRFDGVPSGIRVNLHRPLPGNVDIRSCVLRYDGKGWKVCLQVFTETPEKCIVSRELGVDLGLSVFAYCSDGLQIPNPRIARHAEKEMRRRQRALARCKKGSKRRLKVKAKLVKTHSKIVNVRTSWLHEKSTELVNRTDFVAVEDLNIKGMIKNHKLARSIHDASWSTFINMIAYKAEKAGKHFIKVDPRNTSQMCSGCYTFVPKSLAVRTHSCPNCGLVIDRDWNASKNILQAGLLRAGLVRKMDNVTGSGERSSRNTNLESSLYIPL